MIGVSDTAAGKIRSLMLAKSLPDEAGLRVSVQGGGCSGLSYKLSIDDRVSRHDKVFPSNGVRLIVDLKSYMYCAGLEVDYDDDDFNGGFRFRNPKATATCGCGTSFAV